MIDLSKITFSRDLLILIIGSGLLIGVVLNLLLRIKYVISAVREIINDTMKREIGGKLVWSATRLTMASAWFISIWSYHYDLIHNGFNQTAFDVLVLVALGTKITDAYSKKLNPGQQPNTDLPKT